MKYTKIGLLVSAMLMPVFAQATDSLVFNKEWTFDHDADTTGFESEISAFDSVTGSIWVAGKTGVDILDVTTGGLLGSIDTTGFGEINSVDIYNGVAAFGIQDDVRSNNGIVQFYDTTTKSVFQTVNVGPLPDMVKFTPDGSKLLVANEGTPDFDEDLGINNYDNPSLDPVGSVSIINTADYSVQTATFSGVPQTGSNIRTNVGMDFEPEYIAVNSTGTTAYVTIQEHNAMGVLDINSGQFTNVVGLGVKDFSAPGNEIDPSDKDDAGQFGSYDIKGYYMPDAIDAYEANGTTYVVMANEGDFREDDGDRTRAKDLNDDTTGIEPEDPLGRLRVDNQVSTVTSETDYDLYAPGGRSFSIRGEDGSLIYDSGDILDKAAFAAGIYPENRSDDKGTEPEAIELLTTDGKTYAFVGLERTEKSSIGIFDITDPTNVSFEELLVIDGDISPEGLQTFVKDGVIYLSVANEVSSTTSLLSITAVPEPQTYGMLLAGLAMTGFAARRKK